MQFAVQWPLGDDPAIEFTVKRIPQAIDNNAIFEARAAMKREGIEPPNDVPMYETVDDVEQLTAPWSEYLAEFNAKKAYYLIEQAKQHFVGWKAIKEGIELPPFSQAVFAEFVAQMNISERQMLGLGYVIAEAEDDKKKGTSTSSAQDS